MSKPRLLDLFCGAGGCSVGYERAGFEVVGVDINPQRDYPFEFACTDAVGALERGGFWTSERRYALEDFDAIHASPPCQAYTHARHMANRGRSDHPRLIEPVRELLKATGLPHAIENVTEAPLDGVTLCGPSFGLAVKRHRLFETNFPLMVPPCACGDYLERQFASTPRIDGSRPLSRYVNPLASETTHEQFAAAMGIDWVAKRGKRPAPGLHEAIPPAYTEHIGHYLLAAVQAQAAA